MRRQAGMGHERDLRKERSPRNERDVRSGDIRNGRDIPNENDTRNEKAHAPRPAVARALRAAGPSRDADDS
jgi:hypothetical protein